MKYVVDASVVVKWYVPEIYCDESIRLLEGGNELHVPELLLPEFSNIIWKKVRRNEIDAADGRKMIEAVRQIRFSIHSHKKTILSAYTGAISTGQTVYDWTYLALAISLSCEFVTADEKFFRRLADTPLKSNLMWIGDIN
ncbi:MAG: type II toxin-antitoxin system VapC family toxin [Pyrinomonadaceae bacterium]